MKRIDSLVCILAFFLFLVIQLALKLDNIYASNPWCKEETVPEWLRLVYFSSAVCLLSKALFILSTYLSSRGLTNGTSLDFFSITCISFTITSMAGLSNLLTFVNNWGGTCEDAFGVKTAATQMGEWTACVPLLIYYVLALEPKFKLSRFDVVTLVCIIAGMLCYDLLQGLDSYGFSLVVFILGHIFCIISLSILLLSSSRFSSDISVFDSSSIQSNNQSFKKSGSNTIIRLKSIICFTFPLFVFIYYIGMSRKVHPDVISVMFITANLVTKLIFVSVALEAYTFKVQKGYLDEVYANTSRQSYLRFIMHEVRVPLSSISMGIDALQIIEEERYEEESRSLLKPIQPEFSENRQYPYTSTNESKDTLSMMRDATSFMGNTLNSVLNIQKIEDGKLELILAPFLVKDLVNTVHQALKGTLAKKNIHLIISIDEVLCKPLIGDRFQIEHVLANFVSNSVKFSPEGSDVEIVVKLAEPLKRSDSRSSGKRMSLLKSKSFTFVRSPSATNMNIKEIISVKFSVRDSGVGISLENQAKLFQPFFQIRPGELQGGGGSGVGLSICKRIVELHGGSVGCESEEGTGSTFFFKIPLTVSEDSNRSMRVVEGNNQRPVQSQLQPHVLSPNRMITTIPSPCEAYNINNDLDANAERHCGGEGELEGAYGTAFHDIHQLELVVTRSNNEPRMVLVTDDATTNRKLLIKLLSRQAVTCVEAQDGLIALQMVKDDIHRFQIIFMDNMMPNMDGLQASREIRRLGYNQLIIGLTGHALRDDVEKFLAAGADAVFPKPISLNTLNKIFEHIEHNGFYSDNNSNGELRNIV